MSRIISISLFLLLSSVSALAQDPKQTEQVKPKEVKKVEAKKAPEMVEVVDPYTGAKSKVKKEDLPQEKLVPGVAASWGRFVGSKAINQGQTGVTGEKTISPLSASISRPKGRKCDVTFRNKSKENGYRARYVAEARNEKGSGLQKKTFSVSLKPGVSTTKQMSCYKGGSTRLTLKSGSKL